MFSNQKHIFKHSKTCYNAVDEKQVMKCRIQFLKTGQFPNGC